MFGGQMDCEISGKQTIFSVYGKGSKLVSGYDSIVWNYAYDLPSKLNRAKKCRGSFVVCWAEYILVKLKK